MDQQYEHAGPGIRQVTRIGHRHSTIYILLSVVAVLSVVAMILALGAIGYAGKSESDLPQSNDVVRLQKYVNDLNLKVQRHHGGWVSLTTESVQPLDASFGLSLASIENHLNGVKLSGRIINFTSLVHESLRFKATIDSVEAEFWISRVSPGNSTAFSVYLPGVNISESEVGRIEYINGTVRYKK